MKAGNFQPSTNLLLLIFTLAEPFEHGEPGLFGVRDGQRLELVRRIEGGNDLAHRLFAGRTFRQLRRAQRPAQGELTAAHLAFAFAQLVFVKRHDFDSTKIQNQFCRKLQTFQGSWKTVPLVIVNPSCQLRLGNLQSESSTA